MIKEDEFMVKAGIHTLEIKANGVFTKSGMSKPVAKCCEIRRTEIERGFTKIKINPNLLLGSIWTYSEFVTAMDTILTETTIEEFDITRVDLRLDSEDPEHYLKYEKPYRFLIALLSNVYIMPNRYRTTDLITGNEVSVAAKNRSLEAEHYDRNHKNMIIGNFTDLAWSRFEVRSKRWASRDIRKEFTEAWFSRYEKAIESRDATESLINEALVRKYHEQLNQIPCRFTNEYEFVMFNQDNIYSKKQMFQLLKQIMPDVDENKVKNLTRNIQYRIGVEYVTDSDLQVMLKELRRATKVFFDA